MANPPGVLGPISHTLSLLVAALFVVAGLVKLRHQPDFRRELSDYRLVSRQLLVPLAGILPVLELAAGLFTLVPSTHSLGVVLLLVLLAIFSAVVTISIVRGLRSIHCACFGRSSRRLSWAIPLRNALLAIPLITVLAVHGDQLTLAGIAAASSAWTLGWLLVESTATLSLIREASSG